MSRRAWVAFATVAILWGVPYLFIKVAVGVLTPRTPATPRTGKRRSVPLDGEDLSTSHWEDTRHWLSIYDDLLRFKRGLLARVERDLPTLSPIAQSAGSHLPDRILGPPGMAAAGLATPVL